MRYIIILLTIFFSFYSKSQTFLTVKSVKYENNRISAYNAQNHVVYQVDCKDFVWQRNPDLTIKVWDDIHSFTLTSTITAPTWAAIEDSLRSWQTACTSSGEGSIDITGLDTSSQDTSLVVPSLIENTNTLLEAILLRNLDTTHTDTSLVQSEQLYQIIDSLGVINEKLNHLYKLDTSQQDTSSINYYSQFDRQNDTLSAILQSLSNSSGNDTSNYWILDSIFNELKQTDTFCLTGEIAIKDSLLRTTVVDCNGSNALNVKICNNDTSSNLLSQKIDTTNLNLLSIIDSLAALTTIVNQLQLDCIGSNETYYIDGTNSITLNASEICSYTITVIGGDVDFSENGVSSPFSLPNGYTGSNSFKSGTKYLVNQVVFTGNSGSSKAIIKIIK